MDELSRTDNLIFRRTRNAGHLVHWAKLPFSPCSTRQDYLSGRRWHPQSGYCPKASSFAADGSTLASTVPVSSPRRSGEGCPSSRPETENSSMQNRCSGGGHIKQQTSQCHSLEHADNGQSAGHQPGHGQSYLATPQLEAALGRNVQTQQRQTIQRKTSRCGWSLSILRTKRSFFVSTRKARFRLSNEPG